MLFVSCYYHCIFFCYHLLCFFQNGNIDENENQPKPVKKRRKPVKKPQNPVQSQQKPDSNGAITNGEILNDTHTASVVLKHMLTNQTSSEPAANARPDLIDLPHKKEKIVQNAINDKDVELEDKERDKKPTVQSSELSRNRMISESSTKTKANQRNRKGQRNASVITGNKQMLVNCKHMAPSALQC